MGFWDAVNGAKVSEYGKYFLPGSYDVQIKRMFAHTGFRGHFLIVETTVIASNHPEIPVGDERSWTLNLGKNQQLAFGNVKGFLLAVFGQDLRLPTTERDFAPKCGALLDKATGPSNALQGARVHLEAVQTQTREGNDFTRHQWYPYIKDGYAFPDADAVLRGVIVAPPVAADPTAGWVRSPDGAWKLNPTTNEWVKA